MNIFGGDVLTALSKALDAYAERQRVTAHNLANINTPGFKKSVVKFEEALARSLGRGDRLNIKRTHPRHLGGVDLHGLRPETVKVEGTSMRPDGNNVDMETEMVNLVANTLSYQMASQALYKEFEKMGYIIRGGGSL
ncbi:MAG: flagellar basal body rod protein FlgB [Peptococcaceae bacterium]|nr:flagellar basal body rod protein FlgB [Peptococcaceae bacterium]